MNNCGIFDFKLLKNGTYEAELKECTSTELLFPSNHSDGKKISKFKLAKSIPGEDLVRKIVFQDNASICKLGRRFRKCEEIIIGQGITKIPSKCFEYMFSLKRCELAASVEVIEQKAFYSSRQLETIDIPSDTKLMYIGEGAFESTDSLVTRALLNNCVKHGNSYYLPLKSNPYFCLVLPECWRELYWCVDVHPRCELIYYYYKSEKIPKCYSYNYEMTLGELLKIAKESSSAIKIGKRNEWIITPD